MNMEHAERMTVKQAAEMLGVSVATLRRWDREGRLSSSGRTLSGWRYYLFTDLKTILDDLALYHQKNVLQKTAVVMAQESIAALRAAHHIPLRTRNTAGWDYGDSDSDHQKTSLTEKAQQLLDAVKNENYNVAIDVLTDISIDLKSTEK